MKTVQDIRASLTPILLGAFLFVLLTGCATTPKIDWNARVGTFTYDQAILELGPPEKHAALTDGTRVADWLTTRGRTYASFDFGAPFYRGHYYSGYWGQHYTTTTSPDYYLRLTFSADGKLQSWRPVIK